MTAWEQGARIGLQEWGSRFGLRVEAARQAGGVSESARHVAERWWRRRVEGILGEVVDAAKWRTSRSEK